MNSMLIRPSFVHQIGGGNFSNMKSLQNMHLLQAVAIRTFVDELTFGVGGLGLCTGIGVHPTSHALLNHCLLG